ncbi:MAG TPA: nuclear transport factor 2 family protein [Gracilimonas sp.]|nr:nuclear transport factor 2 family protein [Gracilimonas sp.]
MKKSIESYSLILLTITLMAFSGINWTVNDAELKEAEAIREVLLEGYVHGAFNELNPEAMSETFHEDFAIFSPNGNEIQKYPISNWLESTRQRKQNPEFDPQKNVWDPEFVNISVSGNAASVTLELHHQGKHVYTDYLSLLKFEDGWKVVAKVYHQHSS